MTMTDWVEILLKVDKQEKKDLLLMLADDLPEWSAPLVRELAHSKYELVPGYNQGLDRYYWVSPKWRDRESDTDVYYSNKAILPLDIYINIREEELSYSKMFYTKRHAWEHFIKAIYDPD